MKNIPPSDSFMQICTLNDSFVGERIIMAHVSQETT